MPPRRASRSAPNSQRKRGRRASAAVTPQQLAVIDLDAPDNEHDHDYHVAADSTAAYDDDEDVEYDDAAAKENALGPPAPRRKRTRRKVAADKHARALQQHALYDDNNASVAPAAAAAALDDLPPHLQPAPDPVSTSASEPGEEITGREILTRWEDGKWYDAMVVRYYPREREHKLVYRTDDGVEVVCLAKREWQLIAQRPLLPVTSPAHLVLHGAVIEFTYPHDGKRYQAMIYDHNEKGDRVRIVYLDEHSTDSLKGGGWDIVSTSPCVQAQPFDPDVELQKAEELKIELETRYADTLTC